MNSRFQELNSPDDEKDKLTQQVMDVVYGSCTGHLNHQSHKALDNRIPHGIMYGETPDISAIIQFSWLQLVLYYNKMASYPQPKEVLGHFVGIAINVGDALTFKVLTEHDQVLCRSVIRPADDKINPNLQLYKPEEGGIQEFQTKADIVPIEQLTMTSINPHKIF